MSGSHTPLPWVVMPLPARRYAASVGVKTGPLSFECVADMPETNRVGTSGAANAALVVKAVNAHADLLAFVEKMANPPAGQISHGEAALKLLVFTQEAKALVAKIGGAA